MKQTVCDICGAVIRDKSSKGGVVDGANYMKFKYGLFGLGKWIDVDICNDCIKTIKEEVEKRRGDHA